MQAMYQVIARKFRPQRLEDVVGQEHVTTVIKNAIDSGKIPHAFVFSGPRGVGKTSVARILSKALNCQASLSSTPCNVCPLCLDITASRAVDVFEIDAASHTGVDNIRDLIENSRYAPSVARYKTYIIDEVHMLSKSAFNALLKTLEEPPPHVIFIMATTELSKIPLTVLSRCQRYDFRRIATPELVAHLRSIADAEGLTITDDALMLIGLQADGGMRDAQGMLERIVASATGGVDLEAVEGMLGLVGRASKQRLLQALMNRDAAAMLEIINDLYRYGHDLAQLYRILLEQFRDMLVLKSGYSALPLPREDLDFLRALIAEIPLEELHRCLSVLIHAEEDFKYSSLPKITLETILLRIIAAPRLVDLKAMLEGGAPMAVTPAATAPASPVQKIPELPAGSVHRPISTLPKTWDGFVSYVRDHDQPLYALLSQTGFLSNEDGKVTLSASNDFIGEQVRGGSKEIEKKAKAFFQQDISLIIRVIQPEALQTGPKPSELRAAAMSSPLVKELVTEFNGMVKDVKSRE